MCLCGYVSVCVCVCVRTRVFCEKVELLLLKGFICLATQSRTEEGRVSCQLHSCANPDQVLTLFVVFVRIVVVLLAEPS